MVAGRVYPPLWTLYHPGKTTLSDFLISHNNIISEKLAGKVRFLDSREDEQLRRITMKSSSIALLYREACLAESSSQSQHNRKEYLVHLIDSPGHVDFSSEVSTAVRLCDGALILVDVCEGVCVQTHAVLEQAWKERLSPVLVLNKMDRLITEIQETPSEMYQRLRSIIEQVNVIQSTFMNAELLKEKEEKVERGEITIEELANEEFDESDAVDSSAFFSPERGNVLFCSAADGWAFRISDFARMYSQKLGFREDALKRALWGEFFLNTKTKRITRKPSGKLQKNMFVQFVMETICSVYQAVLDSDVEKTRKIVQSLKIDIQERQLGNRDRRAALRAMMCRWLALSDCVLQSVVEHVPAPPVAQGLRASQLVNSLEHTSTAGSEDGVQLYQDTLRSIRCADTEGPVYAFVSKLIELEANVGLMNYVSMPKSRQEAGSSTDATSGVGESLATISQEEEEGEEALEKEDNFFCGFGRVFSGTIRVGQEIHILGPRYSPLHPDKHRSTMRVNHLFLLMGRGVEPVTEVAAGNIFGLGGVGPHILKYATVTSDARLPPFNLMEFQAHPIVRIAVEPENPADITKLVEGLKLLNQADPSVEAYIQETGEHVLVTAGEVHAERCLTDLRERFAKVPIHSYPPLVGFKETVVSEGEDSATTANRRVTITIKCCPIPEVLFQCLVAQEEVIKKLMKGDGSVEIADMFLHELRAACQEAGPFWMENMDRIWSFGPRRCGPNILLNGIPGLLESHKWQNLEQRLKGAPVEVNCDGDDLLDNVVRLEGSFVGGFQMATSKGPLCEEPMSGVCAIVTAVSFETGYNPFSPDGVDAYGPLSGQLISATKEACRQAFVVASSRLVQAMYKCLVHVPTDALGRTYGVLSRRRARVVDENIRQGTNIFEITAFLPVVESIGFATELREKASGSAGAQLVLSHWETLEEDPFYVPETEEELEEQGDTDASPNIAREYMDQIRKRKGLMIEEKIVRAAEKQRTLSRNK